MIRRLTTALTALTLTGCATLMKPELTDVDSAWTARRQALERIAAFDLSARVASGGLFGMKGSLVWKQRGDTFDIRVSGPFGVGAVSLSGRVDDVLLTTKKGRYHTDDPDAWLRESVGWSFPVEGLRYWVLGLPSPYSNAEISLDQDGRVLEMDQDGWTIEYDEYTPAGSVELPRKFSLTHPEVRIKVVVDDWSGIRR